MKAAFHGIIILVLCSLSGCSTPGSSYASAHPGLSPTHRQIFMTGMIPGGDAVAGMTREQVKLAMGRSPTTFESFGGQDVWIYVRPKFIPHSHDDEDNAPYSKFNDHGSSKKEKVFVPRPAANVKTTIFFQGDRAIHAQMIEERP